MMAAARALPERGRFYENQPPAATAFPVSPAGHLPRSWRWTWRSSRHGERMPRVRLSFHPAAGAKYAAALQWYEERGSELGLAFTSEIARALRLIRQARDRWLRYGTRHRRILVRRFPYWVVYLPTEACIWIVAIAHTRFDGAEDAADVWTHFPRPFFIGVFQRDSLPPLAAPTASGWSDQLPGGTLTHWRSPSLHGTPIARTKARIDGRPTIRRCHPPAAARKSETATRIRRRNPPCLLAAMAHPHEPSHHHVSSAHHRSVGLLLHSSRPGETRIDSPRRLTWAQGGAPRRGSRPDLFGHPSCVPGRTDRLVHAAGLVEMTVACRSVAAHARQLGTRLGNARLEAARTGLRN
jgi:toxin ParE1/3/4